MKPRTMQRVVDGKRYDTDKATVIAHDSYWDGSNWERHGRNQFLYRTRRGRYFATYLTCWQGELDELRPLTQDEAIEMYESLPEHEVEHEEAFPDVDVEDA